MPLTCRLKLSSDVLYNFVSDRYIILKNFGMDKFANNIWVTSANNNPPTKPINKLV